MKHTLVPLALALVLSSSGLAAYAASPAEWKAKTHNLSVSLEQAVGSAIQTVPGTVVEIELDDGDGKGVRYEAEVLTPQGESVEVWIDGVSGQAHVHERDGQAKRKDQERAQGAKIAIQDAIRAATVHTPGKAVKAELDSDWGTIIYEIEVLKPDFSVTELKVDATNGNVLHAH